MQIGRLGTLVGFSLQVCGGGAAMIWPNEKWIGVPIFAVGLVTAAISLIVWFKSNYRARIPWTRKEVPSAPPPSPESSETPKIRSYLKDVNIFSGSVSPLQNPRFTAKFFRNGKRGRFYIDDSFYAGGLGPSSWTQRNRVFLIEINDFVAEQPIDVPLLTRTEHDGQKLWRWGSDSNPLPAHGLFATYAWHRCRVVFISDDDAPPEHFYFIVDRSAMADDQPNVIGHDRFNFAQEWEKPPLSL